MHYTNQGTNNKHIIQSCTDGASSKLSTYKKEYIICYKYEEGDIFSESLPRGEESPPLVGLEEKDPVTGRYEVPQYCKELEHPP